MIKLGVNIDHTATLRQARGGSEPDPVMAALEAEKYGADGITAHLREDRRHIQDRDLYDIKSAVSLPLNMEMACEKEIIAVAKDLKPFMCTLVPEKRMELTTEGGLDAKNLFERVRSATGELKSRGMKVSLFIEPDEAQIEAAVKIGADFVEFHTGKYANAAGEEIAFELERIKGASAFALREGIGINAGHGLNYDNVSPVAAIPGMNELNIGHSVISRAVFTGLGRAVEDMKKLILEAASGKC